MCASTLQKMAFIAPAKTQQLQQSRLPSMTVVMVASTLQKMAPSTSQEPPPAFLTVKPLPSTSPPQVAALPSTPPPPSAATAIPSLASTSSLGDGTLSITADVDDLAGNSATQATDTTSKDTADSTPPTFSSAATSTDGTKVVLTYDEALLRHNSCRFRLHSHIRRGRQCRHGRCHQRLHR